MTASIAAPHAKQSLRVWIKLLGSVTIIEKAIRAHLIANAGSTLPRFDVLAALDRAGERLTMGELSARLLVSNGNVTGLVSRLADDGLVLREADPGDRRTHFVKLTGAGRKAFAAMAATNETLVDSMFESLSDAEMDTLLGLATKLNRAVSKGGS